MPKTVKLSKLVEDLDLRILEKSKDFDEIEISDRNLNRPGLQLSGFMKNFVYKRMQLIGNTEYQYYMEMTPELRYERFRGILSHDIPVLIFTYDREVTQDILELENRSEGLIKEILSLS